MRNASAAHKLFGKSFTRMRTSTKDDTRNGLANLSVDACGKFARYFSFCHAHLATIVMLLRRGHAKTICARVVRPLLTDFGNGLAG